MIADNQIESYKKEEVRFYYKRIGLISTSLNISNKNVFFIDNVNFAKVCIDPFPSINSIQSICISFSYPLHSQQRPTLYFLFLNLYVLNNNNSKTVIFFFLKFALTIFPVSVFFNSSTPTA